MQRLEQYATVGLFDRIWLPMRLYWMIPLVSVALGVAGIYCGHWLLGGASAFYGFSVLATRYAWMVFASGMVVVLLAVPTITPIRQITVSVRPVLIEATMAVVTSRVDGGPVRSVISPVQTGRRTK